MDSTGLRAHIATFHRRLLFARIFVYCGLVALGFYVYGPEHVSTVLVAYAAFAPDIGAVARAGMAVASVALQLWSAGGDVHRLARWCVAPTALLLMRICMTVTVDWAFERYAGGGGHDAPGAAAAA